VTASPPTTRATPIPPRDELTTGELLTAAHRPLPETGDRSRAARARRLARTYLERRRRQLRDELDGQR
jgi:hypothetical protein